MVCSPDFLKTSGKDKKEDSDDPKGIWQIHEALVNYATLMHVLWPYHHAWLVIWRLLVEVRFGELVSADERDRTALITRFFNAVTKENSGRATRNQEPLCFDDVKKKWERIVSASFPRAAAKPAATPQNGNRGQAGATRGGGPGRGGVQRGRVATPRATFKGGPVCFAFNQVGGCGRPTAPGGCLDNGITPPGCITTCATSSRAPPTRSVSSSIHATTIIRTVLPHSENSPVTDVRSGRVKRE
jgi:hypothetical protein